MKREIPEEVKRIQERLMKIDIKPVESMADYHFEKHGREFEKAAIKSVLRDSDH